MHLDSYSPVSNPTHDTYEFLSEGPKGTVKKVVQYQALSPGVYNLAFGDWDEEAQEISDDVRTNNADRDKVLATVAAIVIDFMAYHPGAILFAQGSTPARTRLYQIGIKANWHQIRHTFDLIGFTTEGWEPLAPNKNYKAFALKAKEKV
jgi:hypothetical protein